MLGGVCAVSPDSLVFDAPASKQAWFTCAAEVIRTWGACKQYREEVDAYSDGIEKRKGSEAVGDRVHLWR